jgi:TetR/AcrR family transcriptional repressor of nem operon
MARTIDFDYELALDHAMALFWKHGYAGTTIRELLKAMGIGEGSFYNTLKNKKELYFRCLQRYEETEGRKRGLAFTSAATAAKGIRALFAAILDCLDDPTTPSRLCMQAGMATEEVMADPELRARVERDLSAFHKLVAERLRSDREEGRLPS